MKTFIFLLLWVVTSTSLIVLKCVDVLPWSWVWTLSVFWIPAIFIAGMFFMAVIFASALKR